jgi:hypothetical protein
MVYIHRKFFEAREHHPQAQHMPRERWQRGMPGSGNTGKNGLSPLEKAERRREDIKPGFDAFNYPY